jgi:hypothetical protein
VVIVTLSILADLPRLNAASSSISTISMKPCRDPGSGTSSDLSHRSFLQLDQTDYPTTGVATVPSIARADIASTCANSPRWTISEGNHPLFLQFKEAVSSVLEPYAGKSIYGHHGQRVVTGQRLMQPASDIFLGWVTAPNGRLHDAKIKPLVKTFDAEMLDAYAQACGWVLARAHAKASEISATITGYLGSSNDAFDAAMGKHLEHCLGMARIDADHGQPKSVECASSRTIATSSGAPCSSTSWALCIDSTSLSAFQ